MTFWRVTFPLMLPGIVASLLLTFITSFDEFLMAYFLSGTEATLPVYIWGQLRFPERLPMVLALGALILTGVGGAGGAGGICPQSGRRKKPWWVHELSVHRAVSAKASAARRWWMPSAWRCRAASSSRCWGRRAAARPPCCA